MAAHQEPVYTLQEIFQQPLSVAHDSGSRSRGLELESGFGSAADVLFTGARVGGLRRPQQLRRGHAPLLLPTTDLLVDPQALPSRRDDVISCAHSGNAARRVLLGG